LGEQGGVDPGRGKAGRPLLHRVTDLWKTCVKGLWITPVWGGRKGGRKVPKPLETRAGAGGWAGRDTPRERLGAPCVDRGGWHPFAHAIARDRACAIARFLLPKRAPAWLH